MRVFRDINALPDFNNPVLTIGSFDGVHLGHRQILERLKEEARKRNGETVVITFHPHPRLVVPGKGAPLLLINDLEEKIKLMEASGIDNLVVVPFSLEFANQSPEAYVEDFLIKRFRPSAIVIGYDHKFGMGRRGDIRLLQTYAAQGFFEVLEIPKHTTRDIGISSTRIRNAILEGKIALANELLGHPFSLTGKVVKGKQIGRQLGYPTANISIENKAKIIPAVGIYAVFVELDGNRYRGMMYIGNRPTIEGDGRRSIEVHIFDFKGDIYGATITVFLIQKTREDRRFENLDLLKEQLAIDEQETKAVLASQQSGKTAVVILNYNGKKHLNTYLPSVVTHTPSEVDIIVADNGSTDDSIAFLKKNYPNIRVIELPENLGFAEGYNAALKQISATYYILLNSDVRVVEGWVTPLIKCLSQNETIAACQPKILSDTNPDYFEHAGASGGFIDRWGYPFCRGRILDQIERDGGQYDDDTSIFWATGAAMAVRADLFHGIGQFDGMYFAHFEEIDLCWRLKRAGYDIMAIPESKVFHLGGGTLGYQSPGKIFLNFRNSLFTLFKNEGKGRVFYLIFVRLVLDGLSGMVFIAQGKFSFFLAMARSHLAFYAHLSRLRKRKKIENQKIKNLRIGTYNTKGRYHKSIIWDYFVRKKRKFTAL